MSKLRSKDPRVRKAAIVHWDALGHRPNQYTGIAQNSCKRFTREAPDAAWAIGYIGPTNPDVVAGLRAALKSKNSETRRYAAYTVGLHRGATPLIPELIALLDEDRASIAGTAAHALAEMGPGGTVAVHNSPAYCPPITMRMLLQHWPCHNCRRLLHCQAAPLRKSNC